MATKSAIRPGHLSAGLMPAPASGGTCQRSARSVLTGNSFDTHVRLEALQKGPTSADFSSDVGRKQFGFSHEELDDSTAYYEGQFKLYQRSGYGVLHSPDIGAKYVGEFQADKFHGEGDQVWPDGSRYVGQWRNGQKHGKGEHVSADGLRYEGQWEKGRRHGLGTQTYANRDTYKGGWYFGLCSGVGTYTFADGSRFEGTWANGRYNGTGILYGNDGSRERQWYNSGLLTKREVLADGPPPRPGSRRDFLMGKPVCNQTRPDMHKPTRLADSTASKFLIRRETAGVDLSAPPLKSKSAAATTGRGLGLLDMDGEGLQTPRLPSTAPARIPGASLYDC